MKILNDFIKIYRINNWFYYLGFVLLGANFQRAFSFPIVELIISTFSLAYIFSINDYFDKNLKQKYFILPLFFLIPLFPILNNLQKIILLIFSFLFTLYSTKPPRLKSIPIIGTLLNGIGFSLLFLFGYWYIPINFPLLFFLLLIVLNCTAQLIHEIVDLKEDRKNKIRTTAILLGVRLTKIAIICLLLCNIPVSLWMFANNEINLIFLFANLLFSVFIIYKLLITPVNKRFRILFRNCGIVTGTIWLLSLLML
jgi:4-hydroxybenzoate polyprenyltransferase